MNNDPAIPKFMQLLEQSLTEGNFAKLSLGNFQGAEKDLKKILVKKALIKGQGKLSFTYRYKTRDIVKNHDVDQAYPILAEFLRDGFAAATLMTLQNDVVMEKKQDGFVLRTAKPSISEIPPLEHDHQKNRKIQSNGHYLTQLGITDDQGKVFKNAQDKYRQINKYIELLAPLLENLSEPQIRVADMGSGKGYLTFALYDYLTGQLKKDAKVTGVEYRADMVALCNDIAHRSGFAGLDFAEGAIDNFNADQFNVMIALHACDTATDDAIEKGIKAGAELIVVAPCCHKQIRREMEAAKKQNDVSEVTRHGIFLERQAEMVTDSLRALLLEYAGYKVKVFEFISGEHTAKNIMITAIKSGGTNPHILEKVRNLKEYFGIKIHHLENKLLP